MPARIDELLKTAGSACEEVLQNDLGVLAEALEQGQCTVFELANKEKLAS